MAVIRARSRAVGGHLSLLANGSNNAGRGNRMLRRRPKQRTTCLGVVAVFLVLVVLVVVATVQTSLTMGNVGSLRRNRNAQHLEKQTQDSSPDKRRHLQEHIDAGARYSSDSKSESQDEGKEDVKAAGSSESVDNIITDEKVLQEALETQEEEPVAVSEGAEDAEAGVTEEVTEDIEGTDDTEVAEEVTAPVKPEVSFCDIMRRRPPSSSDEEASYSNPAVIVLGLEDMSSDLVSQVVQQILYPNQKSHRMHQLTKHATAVDYGSLGKADLIDQLDFWSKISNESRGKWVPHVFCQQETHELPTGFSWLTSPASISKNEKAQAALRLIKDGLPTNAVKILRIKRNYLDVVIRHAQLVSDDHTAQDPQVSLDHKTILGELGKLQHEQDAVDKFLRANGIPVLELDFEALFPFDHWTDMVQVATLTSKTPLPLSVEHNSNSNIILRGSTDGLLFSQMESSWREVLHFLGVTDETVTMFDVMQKVTRTHKVHSFWKQQLAISNYAHIVQTLFGTRFQSFLRQPQELHLQDWGEGDEM